jgi:hypothetical protein
MKIADRHGQSQCPDFVSQEADQMWNIPGGAWTSWWISKHMVRLRELDDEWVNTTGNLVCYVKRPLSMADKDAKSGLFFLTWSDEAVLLCRHYFQNAS